MKDDMLGQYGGNVEKIYKENNKKNKKFEMVQLFIGLDFVCLCQNGR